MDPRIRERLVGAFVLVGVVVVLVPAVMKGPDRAVGDPAAAATRSVEIVLDGAATPGTGDGLVPEPEIARPPPEQATAAMGESGGPAQPTAAASTPRPQAAAGPRAAAPTAPAPAQSPAWAVQLGAFSSRDKAERLVADLRSRGYSAFVLEYRADGQILHRVRVGPEQDRGRAAAVAERLRKDGFKPVVAPHP
jgi:DedD protein